jgi:hypothetical protein
MIPLLSVTLLLGSSLAHAMKKTADNFGVNENSSIEKALEFANYLLREDNDKITDDNIREAAKWFIYAALNGDFDSHQFLLDLVGDTDELAIKRLENLDKTEAIETFVESYKKRYGSPTPLDQHFSNLSLLDQTMDLDHD